MVEGDQPDGESAQTLDVGTEAPRGHAVGDTLTPPLHVGGLYAQHLEITASRRASSP